MAEYHLLTVWRIEAPLVAACGLTAPGATTLRTGAP